MSTASGRAVAEIAAKQEQAAMDSQDVDMSPSGSVGSEGMGGDHSECDAGEMGEDD